MLCRDITINLLKDAQAPDGHSVAVASGDVVLVGFIPGTGPFQQARQTIVRLGESGLTGKQGPVERDRACGSTVRVHLRQKIVRKVSLSAVDVVA